MGSAERGNDDAVVPQAINVAFAVLLRVGVRTLLLKSKLEFECPKEQAHCDRKNCGPEPDRRSIAKFQSV